MRFRIAIGSCDETRVWIEFAKDLGYTDEATSKALDDAYREIGRMSRGVIKKYDGA